MMAKDKEHNSFRILAVAHVNAWIGLIMQNAEWMTRYSSRDTWDCPESSQTQILLSKEDEKLCAGPSKRARYLWCSDRRARRCDWSLT